MWDKMCMMPGWRTTEILFPHLETEPITVPGYTAELYQSAKGPVAAAYIQNAVARNLQQIYSNSEPAAARATVVAQATDELKYKLPTLVWQECVPELVWTDKFIFNPQGAVTKWLNAVKAAAERTPQKEWNSAHSAQTQLNNGNLLGLSCVITRELRGCKPHLRLSVFNVLENVIYPIRSSQPQLDHLLEKEASGQMSKNCLDLENLFLSFMKTAPLPWQNVPEYAQLMSALEIF